VPERVKQTPERAGARGEGPDGEVGAPAPGGAAAAGRPLLVDVAYGRLRDLIVTLRLAPGEPVREDALAAAIGVGRTPLREAVKRLQAESLVVVHPRRGTFVAEVNLTDHVLISDVRRHLEGLAAERAAQRATAADRARLHDLAARLARHPGGREAGMALDGVVHREIHRCAHNRFLEADLERYLNLATRIWYLFLDRLPEVDHRAEHLPMVEAVVAGDAERARAFAVAHVEHFERSVRAAI
jgi:DNA-binding GntR family transcriptional regulator